MKSLIMIIFANVLLDKRIITNETTPKGFTKHASTIRWRGDSSRFLFGNAV